MAKMMPAHPGYFNNSLGEEKVFSALEKLPEEYYVIYSRWMHMSGEKRIKSGEADFIVFHPEHGILIIEVKHGNISYTPEEGWKISDSPMSRGPLEQAKKIEIALTERLRKILPEKEKCWVESAVWFTAHDEKQKTTMLEKLTLASLYKKDNSFTEEDLKDPEPVIRKAYLYYENERNGKNTHNQKTHLSDESVKKIVDALASQFHLVPNYSDDFVMLTNKQIELLDNLEAKREEFIKGGAGTGKTFLALEKAKRLSSDSKVLFLCFNYGLSEFLKNKCKEHNNIDVHRPCSLVEEKTGHSINPYDAKATTDYLKEYKKYNWDYKHIIIDEGQDFYDEHLRLLSDIAKTHDGKFFIFYDENQCVQREKIAPYLGYCEPFLLKDNCRNTKMIAETAARAIMTESIAERNPDGEVPKFHVFSNEGDLCKSLAKLIDEYIEKDGIPLEEIVIITLKEKYYGNEFKYVKSNLYKYTKNKKVKMTTVKMFKGLEAEVVIVVDISNSGYKFSNEPGIFNFPSLISVAASRARRHLHFMSVLKEKELLDIANLLSEDNANSDPVSAIESRLAVKVVMEQQ